MRTLLAELALSVSLVVGAVQPHDRRTPVNEKAIPVEAKCPELWFDAHAVGWKWKDIPIVDKIIFRESRCHPHSWNRKDPMGGSRGLMQINGFWTKFLRENKVLNEPRQLFNIKTNLRAGLTIYNYGKDRYGTGWGPWNP